MKTGILLCTLLFCSLMLKAQNNPQEPQKFIEVTGSSQFEIEPDEFVFIIGIREYWEEEFEKKTKPENYRTKIPIYQIEKYLLSTLEKLGVKKENIRTVEIGNYWRERGKDFLIGKRFEITLTDFNMVDRILAKANTIEIDYMGIGELKNKNMEQFRMQGKVEALKAARSKAGYMLASIDKKVGEVISIIELPNGNSYPMAQFMSNVSGSLSENEVTSSNSRKIVLRSEVTVRFAIQ